MILAAPAVAHGATFFVDDDATQPQEPCTDPDPARACTAIADAVAQAREAAGPPHTIHVAPGRYTEEVELEEPEDAGLTIAGSGHGGDPASPASDTIVEHADDDGFNDGAIHAGTLATGVTVRDLRVEVPSGANFLNDPALVVESANATLRDVRAEVLEPTAGSAITLRGADALAERVVSTTVTPSGDALFVGSFADNAVVRDSAAVNSAGRAGQVFVSDEVRLVRSVFSSSETSNGLFVVDGSVGIDSSLLVGGRTGLDARTTTVTLRHATIDAGTPKVADPVAVGVQARADDPDTSSVSVFDSIVLEEQSLQQGGDKQIVCRRSDVPNQVEGAPQGTGTIDCPATPGNPAGNQTSNPGDLFVPGLDDWHLRPGSPAVDKGLASVPGGPDSALDLDRNPRLADGDGDGVAATDMGAFELQPRSEPPPPSNEFEFVKVKRNKRKGTAKLVVRVPGPGELELARTKKLKPATEGAGAAGKEKLLVRSRGKARRHLVKKGKTRVRAQVTYTPTGGEPNTKAKRIRLRKRG
ncbi:MAG: hypothetical protein ACRDL3_10065 [Solirubrobacterales bacterium]